MLRVYHVVSTCDRSTGKCHIQAPTEYGEKRIQLLVHIVQSIYTDNHKLKPDTNISPLPSSDLQGYHSINASLFHKADEMGFALSFAGL